MLKKLISSLFLLLSFFIIFVAPTQAQSNAEFFGTKLHTTVTVTPTGQSRISHEFTITNKTPTTFVSQYGLKISSDKISNVTAVSNGQSIQPTTTPISPAQGGGVGQTSIGVSFPDKLVGEGKERKLTISYLHPDAAIINGSVLEVALPPQANPEDYSGYTTTLITPAVFGGPVRTTPEKHTYTASGNQYITSFNGGADTGVFALYGSQQIYQLDLEYQLENTTNNTGITQIALPPDTSYQRVFYQQLEPKPEKVEVDDDGNWIATYQISGGKTTNVVLKTLIKLTLEPNEEVPIYLPSESLTAAADFWPADQDQIQEIASSLNTPLDINRYVVDSLSYGSDPKLGLNRLGAIEALNQPDQAVCQEYTDLFVTLARAKNIPSRRITGYAQSQNSELRPLSLEEDVLHAWPEYFNENEQRWIPIDPTWEDTTGGVDYFHQLDLNHITFAINGHDSVTPYPAGSYKASDNQSKTVHADFATNFPETEPELAISLANQTFLGLPLPSFYVLQVENLTGSAHYQLPVMVNRGNQLSLESNTVNLLPWQKLEIPIRVSSDSGWGLGRDTISISIYEQNQQFNVISGPSFGQLAERPYLLIGLAIGSIFAALIIGSLLVFRRR